MRSLSYNSIGPEGTAALANVLSQTQIQTLKCASAEISRRYGPLSPPACIETRPGRSACARSLGRNDITNNGKDMSAVIKLAEVLSQTSITSLGCAASDSAIWPHIPPALAFCPASERRLR